jgi:drug/metabolite transporter (DMT)-like permease
MATLAPLATHSCDWQVVAIARCAIPLVIVTLWAKWDGVKLVLWGSPVLWLRSLAGSCSLVGTFFSFYLVDSLTDIYTIANIFPVWVALLSWPMFGTLPSLGVWIAIFCSIFGVAVMQGADLQAGNYASLVVVAVSLFTAVAMMGLNRLKEFDPRAIVVHFSGTALVFAIGCYFLFPHQENKEPFAWVHALELLGVGVTASFGQYFLTKAFTVGDPARMSVASLSQFVFIMFLDVLVLGNDLKLYKLLGVPLILGPTLWLMLYRRPAAPALETEPTGPDSSCETDLADCADSALSRESEQLSSGDCLAG